MLSQGGSLYVDEAADRPGRLAVTIESLRRHRPTFHGAVPIGFAALLPALEADPAFHASSFGRLDAMFSVSAAMHPSVFCRPSDVSAMVRGRPVLIVTGWGSTEIGPDATMAHAHRVGPGCIGTPLPRGRDRAAVRRGHVRTAGPRASRRGRVLGTARAEPGGVHHGRLVSLGRDGRTRRPRSS
ncbi:AMP-binding protein [Streptomyces sp. DASNCL29]|nr:AMP-binding protein [Streptomyces sp. DASNCL29]